MVKKGLYLGRTPLAVEYHFFMATMFATHTNEPSLCIE
jgi:hypothetical protein